VTGFELNRDAAPREQATGARLVSLDALRGFDMFWILGADGAMRAWGEASHSAPIIALGEQFEHVRWEGFAFYDLIFPLFVFIIGISLVFSLGKIVAREGKAAAYRRLVRRSVLLFLLGVISDGGLAHWYDENLLCGVLQRLALSYFFGGLLFLNLRPRGLAITIVGILLGYWALLSFVPVPDIGRTSFAPEENWAHYVDRLMPPYHDSDPESYLSTFPAVATCLLGALAGFALKDAALSERRRVLLFILGGAAMVVLGYLWGLQFPVVKRLWSSSYVLVAGGYSFMLLGLFHLVVDHWGYRRWATPFVWIGMNPLTLYVLTNVIDFRKIAALFVGGPVAEAFGRYGDVVIAVGAVAIMVALARFLYRKQIFLRV
jgi:predicted acyltransferase